MEQKLTITEKIAFIEELKGNVLNAFGDSSDELDNALDEVMEKLKNLTKLSEMTSKTNIEKTFVAHLAMSLASRVVYHNGSLDLISVLSSSNQKKIRPRE